MREIPPLHILCLRVVGSSSCSAETTFAKDENGNPSMASRLLRSFHKRPTSPLVAEETEEEVKGDGNDNEEVAPKQKLSSTSEDGKGTMLLPSMKRVPCIGDGSARRNQANEVDLHHPFAACSVLPLAEPGSEKNSSGPTFYMKYGNPALDCLQSFADALVELGRMDDARLGIHFFEEWTANILIAETGSSKIPSTAIAAAAGSTKKRRRGASSPVPPPSKAAPLPTILGSISLHNCSIALDSINAMVESKMGPYVAVLDLSGVNGLTDEMLELFLPTCTNLLRLSIKNCRRVTGDGLTVIAQYQSSTLQGLDVGGVYNISVSHLLDMVPQFDRLNELHASGLGWSDPTIEKLTELNASWKVLSASYSLQLSQTALRQALLPIASSLQSIALAFCESVVDNALMGILGRNLPNVMFLDLRGNPSLTTVTGWYDGRVSADLPGGQPLTVLGRYSGLSKASVEETRQVHPFESKGLVAILDGTGTGMAIEPINQSPEK
mmetsp:Transcript_21118/g.44130  ORF Transcript_21118/g.44130 Transcript_21118/m.44130 type:complete len:496 (-) Transcript_21118:4788-6275(-)